MLSRKASVVTSLFALCLTAGCSSNLMVSNVSIQEESVWQGTYYGRTSYPMILFISSRTGDAFKGMTWYPTLNNGLLTVTGQIKPDGIIKFTEEEIICGRNLFAGCIYTASLEGNTLKGSNTCEGIGKFRFVLKLAD